MAFSPAELSSLVLLDPDNAVLSGSSVTSIPDSSGSGFNFTAPSGHEPTIVTSDLNGHSSVSGGVLTNASISHAQPVTIFTVGYWNSDGAFQTLMDGAGSNTFVFRKNASGVLEMYCGSDFTISNALSLTTWHLLTLIYNGAHTMPFLNGAPFAPNSTFGDVGSNGISQLHLLAADDGGGLAMDGKIGYFWVVPGVLETNVRQMAEGWLADRLGLTTLVDRSDRDVGETNPYQFIFLGNSMMVGYNGSFNDTANSIPVKLLAAIGHTNYCGWYNNSIDGQTLTQMMDSTVFANQVTAFHSSVLSTYYVAWELHNEVNDYPGKSASDIYNELVTYCGSIHSNGDKVIVLSCLRYTGGDNTKVDALDALLDADNSFADGYVPVHTNSLLNDPSNLTYHASDGTHLTAAGNDLVVTMLETVVNDLTGGSITSVTVSPSSVTLYGFQTQTFTATVVGTGNLTVQWSIVSDPPVGSINSSTGVYTAPGGSGAGAQSATVRATSVVDNTKFDDATVTIPKHQAGGGGIPFERWPVRFR